MRYVANIGAVLFFLLSPGILHGDSDTFVTRKDYPVALNEADLDLFHDSMKENRLGLWIQLRQEGRAWLSKPGIAVTIIENTPPDKVKVQAIDSKETFWTLEGALQKR